jgi:protein arginine kinase activator
MKCSNCGKNTANITYKQNINGEVTNLNLCESCAHKLGIFNSFDDIFSPMVLDLDYILPEEVKCKKCGYTLSKYKSTGLFGCDSCYDTFKKEVDNMLLKIQGKNRHTGKKLDVCREEKNKETKSKDKVEMLREKLQTLINEEKFEEAAKVRDEIKKIEKGGKK